MKLPVMRQRIKTTTWRGSTRGKKLMMVPEVEYQTKTDKKVCPDVILKDALRQNYRFQESKDDKDSLKIEIQNKLTTGYPTACAIAGWCLTTWQGSDFSGNTAETDRVAVMDADVRPDNN